MKGIVYYNRMRCIIIIFLLVACRPQQTLAQQQEPTSTFSGGFRVASLNALLDDLGTSFLPSLFENAGNGLLAEPLVNEKFDYLGQEDFFSLVVLVENLQVDPFRADQLTLETFPVTDSNTTRNSRQAGTFKLSATPAEVKLMASATAGVMRTCPVPFTCTCGVGLTPTITLEELSIEFTLEMVDETHAQMGASNIQMEGLSLDFQPEIEGICDFIGEFMAGLATLGRLEDRLLDLFKDGFLDFVEQTLDGQTILFDHLGVIQLPTGTITPTLNVTSLSATQQDVSATLATSFQANLQKPDFRKGNSYGTLISTDNTERKNVQAADVRGLASAHLSFQGINDLIRSIWYTQWASMATDRTAMASSLCQDLAINQGITTTDQQDACPFLPMIRTRTSSHPDWWFMNLMYTFGYYSEFRYSFVVPPPTLDYVDNQFQGTVPATLLVQGVPRLANQEHRDLLTIHGAVDIRAPIPTYNTETSRITNFEITNLDIRDMKVDFIEKAFLGWLFDPTNFVNSNIIEALLPLVVTTANLALQQFLQDTPMSIPPIPGFPRREKAVQLRLVEPSVTGIASTNGAPGFLDLDGSISLEIIDNPDSKVTPVQLKTLNVTQTEATMFHKVAAMAQEEHNSNATYTYKFCDPVSGSEVTKLLYWSDDPQETFLVETTYYAFNLNTLR